jgi:hypothetical protein
LRHRDRSRRRRRCDRARAARWDRGQKRWRDQQRYSEVFPSKCCSDASASAFVP